VLYPASRTGAPCFVRPLGMLRTRRPGAGSDPLLRFELTAMSAQTEADLGAVFTRLERILRNDLRKRIDDPALAEDLVQDVFVKALVSLRAERRIDNLAGWIRAAARTTLIDHYRAARRKIDELDENMAAPEPEDLRLHQEISKCLRPWVEQLPAIYRDTLVAADYNGETMRALAQAQGVSLSAIKSRASRARRMLREKLLACCDIEINEGLVSDYSRRQNSAGSGECA
jgi:RNA polymerase sigma-70 factor, ECF subfamily